MKKRKHRRKFTCEQDVKEEIKNIFDWYDVWHFMPYMAGKGRAGIPDHIACVRGAFLAVEAKFGKNKLSYAQQQELDKIFASDGVAVVVNETNLDALEKLINLLVEYFSKRNRFHEWMAGISGPIVGRINYVPPE